MTHAQAEQRKRELAESDPDHTWLVRERDGEWEVVKVGLPGQKRPKLTTTTEAAPNPQADDPRDAGQRLIPPYGPFIG